MNDSRVFKIWDNQDHKKLITDTLANDMLIEFVKFKYEHFLAIKLHKYIN